MMINKAGLTKPQPHGGVCLSMCNSMSQDIEKGDAIGGGGKERHPTSHPS